MKKIFFLIHLCLAFSLLAQDSISSTSTYDPHKLFAPMFYTKNGNMYRSASGVPGPKYWQNRADYVIKAELNPDTKMIKGSVTIHYTNNSPDDLDYLWLQLDQNLFKPDSRGEVMVPSDGSRFGARGQKINGGYVIENIKAGDTKISTVVEDTRLQIRLSEALKKEGGKLSISMDFSFLIPENGSDRMGYVTTKNGEIYSIAQWFPRMAVYDDIQGWNTKPYLGAGEFYCEYGDVQMDITVPASYVVMGSGELLNAQQVFLKDEYNRWENAKKSEQKISVIEVGEVPGRPSKTGKGSKVWRYKMENTRDVAWAASPAFVLDAMKIDLPSGKTSLAVSAQPVESNGNDAYGRAVEYIKGAIEFYSKYLSEYPYPMAVNIASNAYGMEYPGIVFCSWESKEESVWGVIDHEFGHTWFPMIVGSNERNYGWMDEGFNTFVNELSSENFNKGEYADNLPIGMVGPLFGNEGYEYIMLTPDGVKEQNMGYQLYLKPGLGLKMLREVVLGKERFDYAFRQYIKNWSFKHPSPDDFFRCMENAAGEDLSWFWRSWFLENYAFDQGLSQVQKVEGGYKVKVQNLKEMALPIIIEAETKNGEKIKYKQGVDVWMKNKDWDVFIETDQDIKNIKLDPYFQLPDLDRSNNIWQSN